MTSPSSTVHPHSHGHTHSQSHFNGSTAAAGSSRSSSSGTEPKPVPTARYGRSLNVQRVGGVRCYWALLRPRFPRAEIPGSKLELEFVHPDPVLGVHLARQKMSLMGRGLIEFIHPHEREQARRDLTSAVSTDDLQGSVTRVRFARLSRLKIILGGNPDEMEMPENWEKIVEDDEYLALDLVLNWVADGMLLGFFHAIRDMDPVANNDPARRAEGWSNFCGTADMPEEQILTMHQNVASVISVPPLTRFPPVRVFQLLTRSPPDGFAHEQPSVIFTWPPARQTGSLAQFDGLYDAAEYADLMQGVDLDPATHTRAGNEVQTTCTTRFGAKHSITSEGVYREVTSVFIPYGSLIFACFQTIKAFELPDTLAQSYAQNHSVPGVVVQDHADMSQFSEPGIASVDYAPDGMHGQPGQGQGQAQARVQEWLSAPGMEAGPSNTSSGGSAQQIYPTPPSYQQSPSFPGMPPLQQQQSMPPPGSAFMTPHGSQGVPPPQDWRPDEPREYNGHFDQNSSTPQSVLQTPAHPHMAYPHHRAASNNSLPEYQPQPADISYHQGYPPSQQHIVGQPQYAQQYAPPGQDHAVHIYDMNQHPSAPSLPHHQNPYQVPPGATVLSPGGHSGSGDYDKSPPTHSNSNQRPLVRPPGDVECCIACGTRESPEWRRSESGVKDLCNACGLRLARQVAKRDGKQKPRKKKDLK